MPETMSSVCDRRKIRHSTRLSAEFAAIGAETAIAKHDPVRAKLITVYWCEACAAWHTGHRRNQARGIAC